MDHNQLASEKPAEHNPLFSKEGMPRSSMVRFKAEERWTSIIKVPNRQIFAVSADPKKTKELKKS